MSAANTQAEVPRRRQRIAVVGSGISGLGAAWLLGRHHDVTVFEADARLGGHTNTVAVNVAGGLPVPVDTGFIVYNEKNYPNLTALFSWLEVPTRSSDMSFGVSIADGLIEYAGDNLNTLFAQRGNFLRPAHWRMLLEIVRFNRDTRARLASGELGQMSLREYLDDGGYSEAFRYHYLLPMGGAIWSCPVETMLKFPAASFAQFFDNHGLLSIDDRPQWRTVVGGGREYIRRLKAGFTGSIRLCDGVASIRRSNGRVTVTTEDGVSQVFDSVVMACHADDSLRLLSDARTEERRILGAFSFQSNEAWLHCDERLMPGRRLAWSSWNYLADDAASGTGDVSVSYWMNRLQSIPGKTQYIVSLNPLREPDPDKVFYQTTYMHPVFDDKAMTAQRELETIQCGDTQFCGAWTGYGFHEDGFRSAVDVARRFGIAPPWEPPLKETGYLRAG